jgi:predicted aspartyl protease
MMTGRMTARREATLWLTVLGPDQRQHVADTVLDTGSTAS